MNTSLQLDGAVVLRQRAELGEIGADRELGGRTRIALTDDERGCAGRTSTSGSTASATSSARCTPARRPRARSR
ncbi:amidase [Burkholderia sp. HMSC10F09]|nr:amidase [Burkholderia sp. HMSC10F09]